tara:strand:+ start:498 stop:1766 length:1269 start_codon:yes stop_codon:yes gene_type:complete
MAGAVLDRSFQDSVNEGAREQLRLVIFSLMGSIEEVESDIKFSKELPEPRLSRPDSGLYAALLIDGSEVWKSPSAITTGVIFPPMGGTSAPGDFNFFLLEQEKLNRFYLSYTVIWEEGIDSLLTFVVSTDQAPFAAQVEAFRKNLYLGLGTVTLMFILALYVAVRWSLYPLRIMATEVKAMEQGKRESLSLNWPAEIQGLADNLRLFISHEKTNKIRYRKAMEDLAHSLKTPLSVIRNDLGTNSQLMLQQIDQMQNSISYQLSKASAIGPLVVGNVFDLNAVLDRLLNALQIAYSHRSIAVIRDLPKELLVRADEGDFMEIFGNVLDNGFKYTNSNIRVTANLENSFEILIEDDGPGIPLHMRNAVIRRGSRVDEMAPGEGIGLSIVSELVSLYGGDLSISDSSTGGTLIKLCFPRFATFDR